MGGKSRLAKSIRDVILSRVEVGEETAYWEPFVGGCGSFEVVAPEFPRAVGSDIHADLMMMWKALMDGWEPPASVTEEEYAALRNAGPSALRGFVGFGCSFGGKWFGGYARSKAGESDPGKYAGRSGRSVLRTLEALKSTRVRFEHAPYWRILPEKGDVVYCDPPYKGTTRYEHKDFDHDAFWKWATEMSETGVSVFVSEYEAPSGWQEVLRRELVSSVGGHANYQRRVDRLFQYFGDKTGG